MDGVCWVNLIYLKGCLYDEPYLSWEQSVWLTLSFKGGIFMVNPLYPRCICQFKGTESRDFYPPFWNLVQIQGVIWILNSTPRWNVQAEDLSPVFMRAVRSTLYCKNKSKITNISENQNQNRKNYVLNQGARWGIFFWKTGIENLVILPL
jgi:hypothetical protein